LGTHKIKIFMNISLKYFDTQVRALVKQLRWYMVGADFIFKLLYAYFK
jgi:hypothetical protein